MRILAAMLILAWFALGSGGARAVEAREARLSAVLEGPVVASRPGQPIPPGLGEPIASAINAYDETMWLVTDASLLVHLARDGSLIQGSTLPGHASAVAVDLDESVWVVVDANLLHFSPQAELLGTRPVPFLPDERATALAIDPLRERAWIGSARGLYQLAERARMVLDADVTSLALDPRSGHIVAIADGALVSVVAGAIGPLEALSVVEFELPLQVTYHAGESAFVVETTQRTWWIDAGELSLKQETTVHSPHATAPFRIDPVIELLRPPAGGAMTQATPEIIARVGALCNDIACDVPAYIDSFRVEAILDGVRLPEVRIDDHGLLRWPVGDVPDSASQFLASAIDRFGHRAVARARWTTTNASSAGAQAADAALPTRQPSADPTTKAGNKLPTVALTSPVAGTVFTLGASISVAANASDPDGSIAKVEFYRGGTILIGTSTSAPFSAIWTSPVAGTHSLTAKAYDNRNGTTTSASVSITVVANQAPSISLTAPAAGAFLPLGESVSIAATATDTDGRVASVEFFDGTTSLGMVSTAPFQIAWAPSTAGLHPLHARAIDDKGAASDSRSVEVKVGSPPVVVITNPLACSTIDGPGSINLAADAVSAMGKIVRVDYYDNGVLAATASTPPWYAVLPYAQLGSHSIVAKAIDDHGLITTSRPAEITVRGPDQPPSVTLTSPANGARFGIGARVDLAATASDPDGSISAVEFRLDYAAGPLIARVTSPPYATTWAPASAGSYSIVAVAIDDRNMATTSSAVNVTVTTNASPAVALTSPTANSRYVAPATVSITANATDSDGTITKVDFFAGTTLIGTSTASPYTLTWSNVAPGSYALTARATDNAGGTSTSTAIPITVASNVAPAVSLTIATSGAYFAPATLSLAANAVDSDGTIAAVEFYANGALIGTDSTAPYGMVWDAVQGGSYALTAKAIDNGGASTISAPAAVSVQSEPTLVFDGALGTAVVDDDSVLVSGYVSAPPNSALTVNGIVTHLDDRGFFQANDVPLAPGSNPIVASLTTQDGQTVTKSVTVDSSGPGLFKVQAAPTEGIDSLQVTFTLENSQNVAFKQVTFDFDGDGFPNLIAYPSQFRDGKLTATATYPVGTWVATVTFYDDQDRVLYRVRKSIVVLMPEVFQGNVRAIYENMLLRLRAGNIPGALTAFTGSAYERYNDIFTQLQPDLPTIVDQLGTITEITFNLDMAELTLVRTGPTGSQKFMIYLIRSEDGIWRIDGM